MALIEMGLILKLKILSKILTFMHATVAALSKWNIEEFYLWAHIHYKLFTKFKGWSVTCRPGGRGGGWGLIFPRPLWPATSH